MKTIYYYQYSDGLYGFSFNKNLPPRRINGKTEIPQSVKKEQISEKKYSSLLTKLEEKPYLICIITSKQIQ